MTKVLLFDIDGTLVLTGGAGQRAMARAFEDIFSVPNAFQHIEMPGRTDSWILSDAVAAHGTLWAATDRTRFRAVYLEHLRHEIEQPGSRKGVMPGVRPLLDLLARRDDVYLALLTGNYEEAARIKLEFLICGGTSAAARSAMTRPIAMDCCRKPWLPFGRAEDLRSRRLRSWSSATRRLMWHAPRPPGHDRLAVATGGYDADALRAAGADLVMEDLGTRWDGPSRPAARSE